MDLFTYGTLQFDEVWRRVTGVTLPKSPAAVAGFAVYRVDGYGFPGMTPEAGREAPGTIYHGVDDQALTRLDAFEGDFYERRKVTATGPGGKPYDCQAYVVPAASRGLLTDEPWTREAFASGGGLEEFLRRYDGFR